MESDGDYARYVQIAIKIMKMDGIEGILNVWRWN